MKQPSVYIIASDSKPAPYTGTLYIGVTSNLIQRIWQHRAGIVEGFSKKYGVHRLVWYEMHETMESAILREKQLKKWRRAWKLRLIRTMNPNWDELYDGLVG